MARGASAKALGWKLLVAYVQSLEREQGSWQVTSEGKVSHDEAQGEVGVWDDGEGTPIPVPSSKERPIWGLDYVLVRKAAITKRPL